MKTFRLATFSSTIEEIEMKIVDQEGSIKNLIKHIKDTAQGGHSFKVAVGPGSEYEIVFYIDGDGAVHIKELKVDDKNFSINSITLPKKYQGDKEIVDLFKKIRQIHKDNPKGLRPADDGYVELHNLNRKLTGLVNQFNKNNRTFSKIKSDDEFREYAHNVMKEAHGDSYSKEVTDKVVDGLLKNNEGADYGELIGRLTSGFGNKLYADPFGFYDEPEIPEDYLASVIVMRLKDHSEPVCVYDPDKYLNPGYQIGDLIRKSNGKYINGRTVDAFESTIDKWKAYPKIYQELIKIQNTKQAYLNGKH